MEGHIPLSHPECIVLSDHESIDFYETSLNFLQTESDDNDLWNFLFSSWWSNDKEQAIKRLLYVADNREVHPDFIVGEYEYNWELVLE